MKELNLPIIKGGAEEFRQGINELCEIYLRCFSGPPWNMSLTYDEAFGRISEQINNVGFTGFVAKDGNRVVAASWYDTPDLEGFGGEKGEEIKIFAQQIMNIFGIETLIFVRETMVDPSYQRKGLATTLKEKYLFEISNKFPNGALIITRHRDDNMGIIKASERYGFQRTRIKVPSSRDPNVVHEYWYKIIRA